MLLKQKKSSNYGRPEILVQHNSRQNNTHGLYTFSIEYLREFGWQARRTMMVQHNSSQNNTHGCFASACPTHTPYTFSIEYLLQLGSQARRTILVQHNSRQNNTPSHVQCSISAAAGLAGQTCGTKQMDLTKIFVAICFLNLISDFFSSHNAVQTNKNAREKYRTQSNF